MSYIPGGGGGGDMTKAVYDADLDSIVDAAETVPWAGITGVPATFPPSAHASSHQNGGADEISVSGLSGLLADAQTPLAHGHAQADITGLVADLAGKAATAHTHAAADVTSGQFVMARLASGSPDGTKFVRDDGVLAAPPGGGGSLTVGVATLDFGNAPTRNTEAAIAVTGQGSIASGSKVFLSLMAVDVADPNGHSADEHRVENLQLRVGDLIAGTGFTIYGECFLGTTQGDFQVAWGWN